MTEHIEFPSGGPESGGNLSAGSGTASLGGSAASPALGKAAEIIVDWASVAAVTTPAPPVRWPEILSVLLIAVVGDITIFRGTGFAGGAAFLVVTPLLLWLGSPTRAFSRVSGGLALMIGLIAARLLWQGSLLTGIAGLLVVIAFAMTLARHTPFVLELVGYALKSWIDSIEAMGAYDKWIRSHFRHFPQLFSLQWILPLIAVTVFGVIFIEANPDQAKAIQQAVWDFITGISRWFEAFSSSPLEVLFLIGAAWYVVGVLRPTDWSGELANIFLTPPAPAAKTAARQPPLAATFAAYRNTLMAVSALFAAYLVFEFQTLWFRKFPKGFHYSGYAHEGAAWLTVALGLATVVLSLIFRGPLLQDSRLPQLRKWAWIWSVENLVLALAVYNRIWIYVGFNGMTRMRVIALLGITSVVVGFLLVLWKIKHDRSFLWLIRRDLLTVTLAGYLYLVMPVDWLVYSYNVSRIMAGDPAPAVQITEHYVSPEGLLTLPPLLDSSDPIIRSGIASLLADRLAAEASGPNQRPGWTSYQIVHERLVQRLSLIVLPSTPDWSRQRTMDWERFRQYAYQWY